MNITQTPSSIGCFRAYHTVCAGILRQRNRCAFHHDFTTLETVRYYMPLVCFCFEGIRGDPLGYLCIYDVNPQFFVVVCFLFLISVKTYVHVPDWKIPLTKKGFGDGQRAGEKIKEYIGDKPLFIYTSPYLRTKQVPYDAVSRGLFVAQ